MYSRSYSQASSTSRIEPELWIYAVIILPPVNMQDSVGHVPQKSKWEFDASVVECFDDMLTRSIPQYSVMRDAVFQIAKQYVQHGTHVIDLGTSNGIALERLVDTFGENNKYIGVEVSEPMLIAAREKFAPHIYRMKKSNSGYSIDEIDRKSASLEGVLVPVTAKWNEDMLREAGFKSVDCFWRWMNFAGWIAIK